MKKQQGIALIAAIFIVIIIGTALVLMATLSVRTSGQTTQNLLRMRAQFAADAAIEEGVQKLVQGNATFCVEGSTTTSNTVDIPAYTEFNVTMRCTYNRYNRPSQEVLIYTLVANAEYSLPGNANYVWAEMTASVEQ